MKMCLTLQDHQWMRGAILAGILSLVAVACGDGSPDTEPEAGEPAAPETEPEATDEAPGDESVTIACLMIDLSLEAFKNICEGVEAAAQDVGARMVLGDGRSDPGTQNQLLETYASQGVDIVVAIAQDPGSLQASIDRAQEAGVMIVALGTALETADVQVVSEFYEEGQRQGAAAAEWIEEHAGGTAHVLITDFPAVPILQDRAQGAEDAIQELAPSAVISRRLPANSREEGLQAAQSALQEDPEIRVVTCISDDACLGAARAFQEADIPAEEVFLIGTDATSSAFEALAAGDTGFKATAGYGLRVFGVAGAIRGMECLRGETVERTVIMNNQIVDASNMEEFQVRDEVPVQTYRDHFDLYISVDDTTAANCPPG